MNTTLGQTWAEKGEAPPFKNLYNRREHYKTNHVPADVCVSSPPVSTCSATAWSWRSSAGVPTNAATDRLPRNRGRHGRHRRVGRFGRHREERWPRKDGMEFPIRMMAVDTGYNTTHVHTFCRRFVGDRVTDQGAGSFGMAFSPPKQVTSPWAGKKVGKMRHRNIGVSFLKTELYAHLRLEKTKRRTASELLPFPRV